MNSVSKRDAVPPFVCLVLFLAAFWVNFSSARIFIPLLSVQNSQRAAAPDNRADDLKIGSPAPAFQMKDVDGKRVALSDLRGRHVLLYFASDCTSCSLGNTAAELDTQYASRRDTRFLIVSPTSAKQMREATTKLGYRATLLPDSDGSLAELYKVSFQPRLYVLDQRGTVRYVQPAAARGDQVTQAVARLIPTSKGATP